MVHFRWMSARPTTFGKYYLTEKIATGGMAEIYLGKLLGPGGFEKALIIKQILTNLAVRAEFVDLFVKEAKTLVGLSHGNIVPVYELGVIDGTYFIAMEYIDGPTLSELCRAAAKRDEHIDAPVAAFIVAELMRGLAYAHRKGAGVIHRDLSPRNVMLSRDGEVKLVDFGIAATIDEAAALGESKTRPVGSFPYMSPEQVRGDALDARSDLFSAGILLWETLTGRTLFHRDTPEATLEAVLHAPIPQPSSLRAELPPELDAISERALARSLDQRYPDAAEFLRDLTRFVYAMDPPMTSAALLPLIARLCPPEKRRADTTGSHPGLQTAVPSQHNERSANASQPKERGDATQPMLNRRHSRGLTQTFATSVAFEEVIRNATPLMGYESLAEHYEDGTAALPGAPDSAAPPPSPSTTASLEPSRQTAGVATIGSADAQRVLAANRRGWRYLLAAMPAAIAIAATTWAARRPSDYGEPSAEATVTDNARAPASAAPLPASKTTENAVDPRVALAPAGADGGAVDGRQGARPSPSPARAGDDRRTPPPPTTTTATTSGQNNRRPADTGAGAEIEVEASKPRGTGELRVGARPWGKVYLNGRELGTTPGAWTVPAGHHTVRVVHPPTSRVKEIRIDVTANETVAPPLVVFDDEN